MNDSQQSDLEKSTVCIDRVRWREVGQEKTEEFWEENRSCPRVGETRWTMMDKHSEFQLQTGEYVWLLFEAGNSFQNGWETADEMNASAVVFVQILEWEAAKKKKKPYFWDVVFPWAKVLCLKVVPLQEITKEFPESKPFHWPPDPKHNEAQIFEMGEFVYYHLITEECSDWFVTTNSIPPRMILRGDQINGFDIPIEICNFEFDIETWPHKVYKPRRKR